MRFTYFVNVTVGARGVLQLCPARSQVSKPPLHKIMGKPKWRL